MDQSVTNTKIPKKIDGVIQQLKEKYAYTVNASRLSLLEQILEQRAQYHCFANTNDYCSFLMFESHEQEWLTIIDQLTVKETYFFRNIHQFQYLENYLITEWVKRKWRWSNDKNAKPEIRILSAGCSTGEEAYSVAISLVEALRYYRLWNIMIDAIDISSSAIEQAKAARYPVNDRLIRSISEMNDSYVTKYFTQVDSELVVKPEIREMVNFKNVNLKSMFHTPSILLPKYDLILCRNVMIYFSFLDQCKLVQLIYDMLNPDGHVFMGDAEVLHIYNHDLELVDANRGLIYRKKGE